MVRSIQSKLPKIIVNILPTLKFGSSGVFFEGFEDCKKIIKELLLDFNTALLIPSIDMLEEIAIAIVENTTEEAVKVQVIDVPPTTHDNLPPTSFEVIIIAKVPATPIDA